MPIDLSNVRLGRKAHDPAALAAAPAHKFGAVPPPVVLDRSAVEFVPGLYGNDYLPDCTAAGLANAARAVAALNDFNLVVDPDLVPAFYAGCVGCAPTPVAMASTDGAVLLDVLQRQAGQGFDVGAQELVGLYGTVTPSITALALAMARLGHVYLGVTLHDRDMQANASGDVWDVQQGRDDGTVVGGHCIMGWDYTGLGYTDTVRVATWGKWQPATWAWVAARLDEAHALVWRQLARADGLFYSGLTADGLVAEL